jgi:hypothetical protein
MLMSELVKEDKEEADAMSTSGTGSIRLDDLLMGQTGRVADIDIGIGNKLSRHSIAQQQQQQQHHNQQQRIGDVKLSAETIRILSSLSVNTLSLPQRFDLLYNDASMLKAAAVQGALHKTNLRFLAWMIFLECVPMERARWCDAIAQNRRVYERVKRQLCCDPQRVECNGLDNNDNKSSSGTTRADHPLSQSKTVFIRLFVCRLNFSFTSLFFILLLNNNQQQQQQ